MVRFTGVGARMAGQLVRSAKKNMPKGRPLNPKQKKEVHDQTLRVIRKDAELKFADVYDNVAPVAAAALVTARSMTAPSQGIQDSQRVGDKINVTSALIKFQVNQTAGLGIFRLIIFKWKMLTTIKVPTLADILLSPASAAVTGVYQYRIDTQKMYTILFDKTYPLQSVNNSVIYRKILLTKKLGTLQFDAGSNDGIDKLYYFILTDTAGSNTLQWYSRVRYYDA